MLHCKRLTYKKYDSRPAGGEPPTAGLPSGENGWCLLLEQTRVRQHAVLSINMAADPHAVGAIGGQNYLPLGQRLIFRENQSIAVCYTIINRIRGVYWTRPGLGGTSESRALRFWSRQSCGGLPYAQAVHI